MAKTLSQAVSLMGKNIDCYHLTNMAQAKIELKSYSKSTSIYYPSHTIPLNFVCSYHIMHADTTERRLETT